MKVKPILLEDHEGQDIFRYKGCIGLNYVKDNDYQGAYIGYNIYLTDQNVKIEEGDWFIKDKMICQCNETTQNELGCIPNNEVYCNTQTYFDRRNCIKILVTTDKDLIIKECFGCSSKVKGGYKCRCEKLPLLSSQSIKLLVDYYNRERKMPDEVEVEYIKPKYVNSNFTKPYANKEIKLNLQGEVEIKII
jgi:hypothetical protein